MAHSVPAAQRSWVLRGRRKGTEAPCVHNGVASRLGARTPPRRRADAGSPPGQLWGDVFSRSLIWLQSEATERPFPGSPARIVGAAVPRTLPNELGRKFGGQRPKGAPLLCGASNVGPGGSWPSVPVPACTRAGFPSGYFSCGPTILASLIIFIVNVSSDFLILSWLTHRAITEVSVEVSQEPRASQTGRCPYETARGPSVRRLDTSQATAVGPTPPSSRPATFCPPLGLPLPPEMGRPVRRGSAV